MAQARVEWKKIVVAGQNANADWADNLARAAGKARPQATSDSPESLAYAKFTGGLAYMLSRTEVTYLKYVRTEDGGRLGVRVAGGRFFWVRVADVALCPMVHQRLRAAYKSVGR